ncbi:MAG: SDR family oxidoreductase [Pirellulaceae bacterium]
MTDLAQLFGTPEPVALVTGSGAPRVGNHVARALGARGYRLVIHANTSLDEARTTADELQRRGAGAIAVQANLAEEGEVEQLIAAAVEQFGRIDALVNCAAIWESKPLDDVRADDVRRHFEINTLGTFLCCQHVGRVMAAQSTGGAIVNLGDWAIVRPYANYAAYFPSKGAIPTLTRTLAVELAARNANIRVNCVSPGPVMLPASLPEAERRAAIEATLVKREGSPANVADAVIFLLENDFITGVTLPVDGGRSVYAP